MKRHNQAGTARRRWLKRPTAWQAAAAIALAGVVSVALVSGQPKPKETAGKGAIVGVVVGPDDKLVAGAEVAVLTWDQAKREPKKSATTRTDDEGRFRLENLPLDTKTYLRAEAPGYATESLAVRASARDWQPVQVRLEKPGVLVGQIVDAETGEPFVGTAMRLQLWQSDGGPEPDSPEWYSADFTTDIHGEFKMPGLRPGVYGASISSAYLAYQRRQRGSLELGMPPSGGSAILQSIVIRRMEDTRLDALPMVTGGRLVLRLGPPEALRKYREVLAAEKTQQSRSVFVGFNGRIQSTHVSWSTAVDFGDTEGALWMPVGRYTLDLTVQSTVMKPNVEVEIRRFQDTTVDFTVPMPTIIAGRVLDERGKGIENAAVSKGTSVAVASASHERALADPGQVAFAYGSQVVRGTGEVSTGPDGTFRLVVAATERLTVSASAAGYRAQTKEITRRADATTEAIFRLARLPRVPSGKIVARVALPDGKPMTERGPVRVEITKVRWEAPGQVPVLSGQRDPVAKEAAMSYSGSGQWKVDQDGRVAMDGVVPRDYYMRITPEGHGPSDYQWVRVLNGQETQVTFVVKSGKGLTVRVVDSKSRQPVPSARLLLCEGDVDEVTVLKVISDAFRTFGPGIYEGNTGSWASDGRSLTYRGVSRGRDGISFPVAAPPPPFALAATADGYAAAVACFDKAAEVPDFVVIELTRLGPAATGVVRVRLVDEQGKPVDVVRARCQLMAVTGERQPFGTGRVSLREAGTFTLEDVWPASYFVLVTAPDHKAKSAPTVEVKAGETAEVQVTMVKMP